VCWACDKRNAGLLADSPLLCYVLLAVLVASQLLGESNMSTASDVYSFGIIMYEMLTFKIPFEECAKAMVRVHLACSRSVVPSEVYSTVQHSTAQYSMARHGTAYRSKVMVPASVLGQGLCTCVQSCVQQEDIWMLIRTSGAVSVVCWTRLSWCLCSGADAGCGVISLYLCLQVAIKVLAHAMRPQIPTFDKLPPNTSRICECCCCRRSLCVCLADSAK
jgi:serine/threonine protein kinase